MTLALWPPGGFVDGSAAGARTDPALNAFRWMAQPTLWAQAPADAAGAAYGVSRHSLIVVQGICSCGPQPPCPPCPLEPCPPDPEPCPPETGPPALGPCPPHLHQRPVAPVGAWPFDAPVDGPMPGWQGGPCAHDPDGKDEGGRFCRLLRRRIGHRVRVRAGSVVAIGTLARVRRCYVTVACARRGDRCAIELVHIPEDKVQSITFR